MTLGVRGSGGDCKMQCILQYRPSRQARLSLWTPLHLLYISPTNLTGIQFISITRFLSLLQGVLSYIFHQSVSHQALICLYIPKISFFCKYMCKLVVINYIKYFLSYCTFTHIQTLRSFLSGRIFFHTN